MLTDTQIDWLCYKYAKMNEHAWCRFQGKAENDPFLRDDGEERPIVHLDITAANEHIDDNDKGDEKKGHLVLSTFGLRRYDDEGKNVASLAWQQLYDLNYQYSHKTLLVSGHGQRIHMVACVDDEDPFVDGFLLLLIDEIMRFDLLAGDWQVSDDGQQETTMEWDEVVARIRDEGTASDGVKLKKEGMGDWVTLTFIAGLLEPEYVKGDYLNEPSYKENARKDVNLKPAAQPAAAPRLATRRPARPAAPARSAPAREDKPKKPRALLDVNNVNDENALLDVPGLTKANIATFFSERRRRGGFQKGEDIVDALGLAPHFAAKIDEVVTFKEYTGPVGTDTVSLRGRVVDD